jgi:hypothetical protein
MQIKDLRATNCHNTIWQHSFEDGNENYVIIKCGSDYNIVFLDAKAGNYNILKYSTFNELKHEMSSNPIDQYVGTVAELDLEGLKLEKQAS